MTRVAVATTSRLAADAARQVAEAGGNAVDCAIAAVLVSMNTEPGVCALAGSAYVTVWPDSGSPVTLDGNVAIPGRDGPEISPQGAVPVHMEYGGGVNTIVGAASVAVPGALAALARASGDYGRVPWKALLAPSVDAARTGFPLPSASHYYLQFSGQTIFGRSDDGFHALHGPSGELKKPGDRIVVPHLAESLAAIGEQGADHFYRGELAGAIVRHVERGGGNLTRRDLADYVPIRRDSLLADLPPWRIAVNPPPAVGGAVLAAMLVAFGNDGADWNRAALQRLLEVQRAVLGYRRTRLDLSDDVPAEATRLLNAVREGRLPGLAQSASTVHTSAVDDDGLACAITASAGYGSGEMPAGTGLWLNNCLGELELNRRGLRAAPAGARLPSNMTPSVARGEGRVLAIGSPGADRITTALLQVIVHYVARGLSLEEAIAHPRLHVDMSSDETKVALEPGLDLDAGGLPVVQFPDIGMYFGGVGAALFDERSGFSVAADPRREGATFVSPE